MPSVGNLITSRNSSKDAAQEISETGINVAHSLEKATEGGIAAGYAGLDQAYKSLDTGVGNANSVLDQKFADALKQLFAGLADAQGDLRTAEQQGRGDLNQGKTEANDALRGAYDQTRKDLDPYLTNGALGMKTLADFVTGEGSKSFVWDPNQDPGYQARLQQAQKAIERSAAASGRGTQGGSFAKALSRMNQDYASNEYGKSFDRFQTDRNAKVGMYKTLADIGLSATGVAAAANTHYGDAVSGNDMATADRLSSLSAHIGDRLSANDMAAGQQGADLWAKLGSQQSANWQDWGTRRAATALQGNEWIGDFGLKGAALAGGSYMDAARARAAGHLGAGEAWKGFWNSTQQGLTMAMLGG